MNCPAPSEPESVCNASSFLGQNFNMSLEDLFSTPEQAEGNKTSLTPNCTKNNIMVCSITNLSTSAVPICSDDLRCTVQSVDLMPHQSSLSSTKTYKIDFSDEDRRTISSESCTECEAAAIAVNVDSCNSVLSNICSSVSKNVCETLLSPPKLVTSKGKGNNMHTTSKDEKQRQNEEIIIMESSSISSETASWESVPSDTCNVPTAVAILSSKQADNIDLQSCEEFLLNERKLPKQIEKRIPIPIGKHNDNTQDACTFEPDISDFVHERKLSSCTIDNVDSFTQLTECSSSSVLCDKEKKANLLLNSGTTACFIDASSLCDEDEVLSLLSMDGPNSNNAFDVNDQTSEEIIIKTVNDDIITRKFGTFHKEFAKCHVKSTKIIETNLSEILSKSSSSSNSTADSPQKGASLSSTNNLSDEEKLWKREQDTHSAPIEDVVKKHSEHNSLQDPLLEIDSDYNNITDESVSSTLFESTKHREVPQYKQSACVFQKNNQYFNILSPATAANISDNCVAHSTNAMPNFGLNSDLSYSTDYSSSSPTLSLVVWPEHDNRPSSTGNHHRNNCMKLIPKPTLLPETPHNSIVHIDNASGNNNASPLLSHQLHSGAYCSNATEFPILMPRTVKHSRFDERNPIISGGISIKDIDVRQYDRTVKRKSDTYTLVAADFISLNYEPSQVHLNEQEIVSLEESKIYEPKSGFESWVVDISDCRLKRQKSSTSGMEATSNHKTVSDATTSSRTNSCGIYVSLDDIGKNIGSLNTIQENRKLSNSYTTPKSDHFYGIIENKLEKNDTDTIRVEKTAERRNMFSLFIDISGKNSGNKEKKEPAHLVQRFSNLRTTQRRANDIVKSTKDEESKCPNNKFQFNQPTTEAPIRLISAQERQSEGRKRHSWCSSQSNDGIFLNYKRSISLIGNSEVKESEINGLMSIIDKLPIISKTASFSIDNSLSLYDDNKGSKSEISSSSNNLTHNSSDRKHEDGPSNKGTIHLKKRRRDVAINETFDKSSLTSITDGLISKDLSPASSTGVADLTFYQHEEAALNDPDLQEQLPIMQIQSNRSNTIIMETIMETKETSSPKKCVPGHTMETLNATIEKQKNLLETVSEHGVVKIPSFVKLSDMDKPIKYELHSPDAIMSRSVGNHRQINRVFRESKTRPHSWTMTRSTGNSFLNFTNSVENYRSLSRLFPNFTKELSYSLPNDMKLELMDNNQTDISADSSLASSFSRSCMDESSLSCKQPRRLGEDLLKMFLQEIATDMIVEVHGRRISAHKCILRSRCQYFAAMLAGNGTQDNVSLQGYSFSSVHFALCHIYSGATHPPDGISLMELAALADLLGLEGLKEVTAYALKTNYCHNFHKPCTGCIDGILQVLPVALNHGLDDLYRKCLRWTCRYYLKVWPTRQFAQLPADIMERCRQQIVVYLTSESVLDTVLDCDNLLSQLVSFRWGRICENLVRDILDESYTYIANHFASLVASDAFLSLGHDRSCHIARLEEVLLRAASALTPDQACRSYQRVTRLNTVLKAKVIQIRAGFGDVAKGLQGFQEEDLDWDPEYIRLVSAILSIVEQCIIRQCARAMRVTAWQRMDLELRKKIQMMARITEPLEIKRNKPVSKAFAFSCSTRNQNLYQVKLAMQAHSKQPLAQDTQLYKSTQTQAFENMQRTERSLQVSNDTREGNHKVLKSSQISQVHVPRTLANCNKTQITTASKRSGSVNTNGRKETEVPISTADTVTQVSQKFSIAKSGTMKTAKPPIRLTDVRPRYLEPRKMHHKLDIGFCDGAVHNGASSRIKIFKCRGMHISSSDSSHNSSPVTCKSAAYGSKIPTKSTNKSLDRLASPSRSTHAHARVVGNERFCEIGPDSATESMESSIINSKTVTQDSTLSTINISCFNSIPAPSCTVKNTKLNSWSQTNRADTVTNVVTKNLLQQHNKSTGSSRSSINTTKLTASRFSSHSSTYSSNDVYKKRSLSVPVEKHCNSQNAAGKAKKESQRYSFLSAKSREILAERAKKNEQNQREQSLSKKAQVISVHSGSYRSVSTTTVAVTAKRNHKCLPSNIPTRQSNLVQCKKTISQFSKEKQTNEAFNCPSKVHRITNNVPKTTVEQEFGMEVDWNITPLVIIPPKSKLERSSTFCKDSSEIEINDLQIFE